MAKLKTGGIPQNRLIKRALFGKTVKIRMRALLLLAHGEAKDGGWLLESALKFENLFSKH